YGRKEHFILPMGRISTAGYEVSTASFILITAYELVLLLILVLNKLELQRFFKFSHKYPIVEWESHNLGSVDMEDLHVYKIIRADGNTSYHKSLSIMLRKFDRQYFVDLHRLVMKRFEDTTLEGYNLLLWGDLKLEAEAESTMAFELLKFIKSQLEE
ncbi:hypothetical protein Tco_0717030, partial [Tanacetum coccineum]